MKTARERAEKYLNDHFDGRWDSKDLDMLELAFKEQDKITRHACAEAVVIMGTISHTPIGNSLILKENAHKACMNVKAV